MTRSSVWFGHWVNASVNWVWYLILLLVFFVPLSQEVSMRILGFAFLISLLKFSPTRVLEKAWDLVFYFAILGFGLLYSEDYPFGVSVLETSLSLVFIPILFGSVKLDKIKLDKVAIVFFGGLCLGSIICLTNAMIRYSVTGLPSAFVYYELTSWLDMQPTYYAYFLVFAITWGLDLLSRERCSIQPIILIIMVLFLFLVLLLTGGRTTFISMLLVCSFFVLKFLLEPGSKSQRMAFGLVLVIMVGLFLVASLAGRTTAFNDSWNRYDLWASAIASNDNYFLGVGTGDYKMVLNQYFMNHDMQHYASENLNSHNQFIQTYLSNGVLGLISIVLLLARPLYLAFRNDNVLTILVFFPFLIYGMTEVFLGRYQGIVFFTLVHQVFVSYLLAIIKPTVSD